MSIPSIKHLQDAPSSHVRRPSPYVSKYDQMAKGMYHDMPAYMGKLHALGEALETFARDAEGIARNSNLTPRGQRGKIAESVRVTWGGLDPIRKDADDAQRRAQEGRARAARGEVWNGTNWTAPKATDTDARAEQRAREVRDELRRQRALPNGDLNILSMYHAADADSPLVRAIEDDPLLSFAPLVPPEAIEKARTARINASPTGEYIQSQEYVAKTLHMALNLAKTDINEALARFDLSVGGDTVAAIMAGLLDKATA